jgi:hypothetical protein
MSSAQIMGDFSIDDSAVVIIGAGIVDEHSQIIEYQSSMSDDDDNLTHQDLKEFFFRKNPQPQHNVTHLTYQP